MILPSEVHNHSLALILIGKDKDGKDEWVVAYGKGCWHSNSLSFVHDSDNRSFQIPRDAMSRLRKVDDDISSIIKVRFCITLTVGDMPEDANEIEYIETGLKWPG